jgi:DNA-binding LacI/PurR family transcriptional regulator
VAWLGSTSASQTAIERWGGVLAGVRQYGMELPDELVFEQISEASLQNLVSSLLLNENPPTAIVALWGRYAAAVARVARAAGLQPGDDFDLIGWTNTEFKDEYIHFFHGEPMPAVAWSIKSMAEIAIARLVERSQNPDMPTVRINIATKIIFDETPCVSSVLKTQITK